MARTGDPHPQGYLAFACFIEEHFAKVGRIFPVWIDPAVYEAMHDKISDPGLREFLSEWTGYFDAISRHEEAGRLAYAGMSAEALQTPEAQAYIDHIVTLRRLAPLSAWQAQAGTSGVPADEWRPARETVVDVIVGVHMGIGTGNKADTARALNRGIARKDAKAYGVTPSEVRNAIDRFARDQLPLIVRRDGGVLDLLGERVAALAVRATATSLLWQRLEADDQLRSCHKPFAVEHLIETGKLYRWRSETIHRLAMPSESHVLARSMEVIDRLGKILAERQKAEKRAA